MGSARRADAQYLVKTIQRYGVSMTPHYVPTMLEAFIECGGRNMREFERVFSSGEALGRETVGEWCRQMGANRRLHNLYGPTEAAVDVTYWECKAEDEWRGVPIGNPSRTLRSMC